MEGIPVHVKVSDSMKSQSGLKVHENSDAGTTFGTSAGFTDVLTTQSSFQQLSPSEQEELKAMLCDDVRKTKCLFGCLVTRTCESVDE